ncbi:MAG: universal stress protein [Pseudomonadota bacterium]
MSVTVALGGNIKSISPAIETAIQVAKKFGTSLNGFCAMPDPAAASIYVTGAETVMLGTSAIASITEAQNNLVHDLNEAFTKQTRDAGAWLKASFEKQVGSVALHSAARAALSDAFIVPKEATQSSHSLNPVFEHVLMETRLPLILAPSAPKTSETCLIAWDGSPLSARAIRMHMPLIATFKTVVIAENSERVRHQWATVSEGSTERLIEILQEQRLNTERISLTGPVSEALLSACETTNASLVVMGAYGHMRIGQMLFGGTTSKMLRADDAPALALCH